MRVFGIHLYAFLYACFCHTFVCVFFSYICIFVFWAAVAQWWVCLSNNQRVGSLIPTHRCNWLPIAPVYEYIFFIHLYACFFLLFYVFFIHLYACFCHTFVCVFVCVFCHTFVCVFFSYICIFVFWAAVAQWWVWSSNNQKVGSSIPTHRCN